MSFKSGIKAPSKKSGQDTTRGSFSREGSEAAISRSSSVSTLASVLEGNESPQAGTDFEIGDRVWVNGTKPGYVQFIGETQFAPGLWAGIKLDDNSGKNDGSVAGVKYFDCDPERGIFIRPHRLGRQAGSPSSIAGDGKPKLSSGRATPQSARIESSYRMGAYTPTRVCSKLKPGERVIVNSASGPKLGTLQFIGTTEFAPGEWAGIELDDPVGKNDGSVSGKRYFECPMKHGLFAPVHKVSRPGTARSNAGSLQNRSYSRESLNSTTSSVTSSRAGRVKLGITSLNNAQKPPKGSAISPTQSALQDVLKEKEEHIEQLLKENEHKRMEVAKVTVEMQEARQNADKSKEEFHAYMQDSEAKIIFLESNCKKAELAIKSLSDLLQEEKGKVEDLQFRFEEERILKNELETLSKEEHQKIEDLEHVLKTETGNSELNSKLQSLDHELKEKVDCLTKVTDDLSEVRTQLAMRDAEINQLTSRLDVSLLDVQHLTSEVEKAKTVQERVHLLEAQCKAMEDEKQNTARLLSNLQSAGTEAQSKFSEKESEICALQSELQTKTEEIVALQNTLSSEKSSSTQKNSDASQEANLAREQIATLTEKINAISSELSLKADQFKEKEKEIETLSELVADKDVQLVQFNQETEELKKKHNNETDASKSQIRILEEKISLLEDKSTGNEVQLSQKVTALSSEVENISFILKGKEEQLEEKMKASEDLLKSVADKDGQIAQLNEILRVLETKYNDETSAAKCHVQSLEEKLSHLMSKSSGNEAQLLQVPELENKNKELRFQCEEKESSNVKLQSEITNLSNDLNTKNDLICELKQQLLETREEICALSQGNSEATTMLQNKLIEMKTLYENAQNEYRTNLDRVVMEKESLSKSLQEQESVLAQNESAIKSVKEMLSSKESEILKVNSELQAARNDIDGAHNAMKNFQEQALLMQAEKENFLKDRDMELFNLRKEASDHSALLEGKSKEVLLKQKEVDTLCSEIKTKEGQISELGVLVTASQKQLELLKKQNEDNVSLLESKVANFKLEQTKHLEEKEKVLRSEIEKLEKEVSEKNEVVASERNRYAQAETQLTQKESAINDLKLQLKTEGEKMKNASKNEEKTITNLKAEINSFKSNCEKLETENKELIQQEQSRKKIHQELEQTKDALLKDKMEQQALVKDRENKLEMLQREVDRMRKEFIKHKDELQQKLDVSQMEVQAMKEFKFELEMQHGVLEELQQQLHDTEEECGKLKKQIQEKDVIAAQKTEIEGKMKLLEAEVAEKSNTSCELLERNQKLYDDIQIQKTLLKAKEQELETLKNQKSQKDSQLRESSNTKIKQLEQEKLALATEISNLKTASSKNTPEDVEDDEKETLRSQIDFLNSIIVDMQKEKEEMKRKEMAADAVDSDLNFNGVRQIPPRLFCDICDMFDLHDTEDCPTQSSSIEEVPHSKHGGKRREERPYCNSCEVFGHWTLECDNEETF